MVHNFTAAEFEYYSQARSSVSINEFIIRKLYLLAVTAFRFISAFLHV